MVFIWSAFIFLHAIFLWGFNDDITEIYRVQSCIHLSEMSSNHNQHHVRNNKVRFNPSSSGWKLSLKYQSNRHFMACSEWWNDWHLPRKAAEQLDPPSRLVSETNQRRRARSCLSCSPWPLSLLSGTKVNEVPRAFLKSLPHDSNPTP